MTEPHYHTLYGIAGYGIEWTDDRHDTPDQAWGAVRGVLKENWEQDRDAIKARPTKYGHIARAYTRAVMLSLTLGEPGRVHIPSLDKADMGLTLGVVACSDAHLCVAQPC